jgi:hypothetical protein
VDDWKVVQQHDRRSTHSALDGVHPAGNHGSRSPARHGAGPDTHEDVVRSERVVVDRLR